MQVFEPIDPVYFAIAFASVWLLTNVWVFVSTQKVLKKNFLTCLRITLRLGLVFVAIYTCFFYAPRISWVAFGALSCLTFVGVMIDIPVSGVFSFALLYVFQEFVLGFPARHERRRREPGTGNSHSDLMRHSIGELATTVSPLRPIGEVTVDVASNKYTWPAKTFNGQLLDGGVQVEVIAVQQGKLIVKPLSAE